MPLRSCAQACVSVAFKVSMRVEASASGAVWPSGQFMALLHLSQAAKSAAIQPLANAMAMVTA